MLGRKKPQIRYWSNASPPRMKTMVPRPSEFQAKQRSDKVGKQLLLTLVQSLPPHATEPARSRSSCAPSLRRRVRTNSCRSLKAPEKVTHTQPPVRLQTGMAVRQVSGADRTMPRAAEPARPSVSFSVETFLRRRKASAKAKAKAREEELEKHRRVEGGDDPSPKRSREASSHSIEDVEHSSHKSSKHSSGKSSHRSSEKSSAKSSHRGSEKSSTKTSQKSSVKSSEKNSSEKINSSTTSLKSMAPKDSFQDISEEGSQTGISQRSSQDIAQGDVVETQPEEIKEESEEESKEPTHAVAPRNCREQLVQTKARIYPCFRGEYPSRNCPGSYVWFKAAVPDCANIVAIRDDDQEVMRQAEYVASCEVTEEHYLTMDEDNADDLPVATPCKPCRQATYTQKPQQQQHQQQDANWFGSSHMQQQVPCRQQQAPCRQSQVPCRQQQLAYMQYSPSPVNRRSSQSQQQRPLMQQQRSSCRQNAPQKLCWKCQDQQNMALQVPNQEMQPSQIQDNYSLTKLLAVELKQQMEIAQAQIAQVQLQLQLMNTMATERDEDEDITENDDENLEEGTLPLEQLQVQPMQGRGSQPSRRISQASGQRSPRQQPIDFGPYPEPLPMPKRSSGYQEQATPFSSQHSASGLQQVSPRQQAYPPFPPSQQESPPGQRDRPPRQQQLPPYQQERPPSQRDRPSFQRDRPPRQQPLSPCQQQLPPCQPIAPCQQQQPPCQQQLPSYPCQQEQALYDCQEQHYMPPCQQQQPSYPCQQNLNTNQTSSPSPPKMCPYAPNYCPSCCCQRYAQMRFMMPRCWPR